MKKILLIFFVITTNVYSQKKKDCSDYIPLYMSGDRIIYTDSTIVNGVISYTDSIVVDISVSYKDSTVIDGSIVYTDSGISYKVNYPINSPFKNLIYRDYCGIFLEMFIITTNLWLQEKSIKALETEKKYYIFSADSRFISYASVSKNDGELYAKYNPIGENNNGSFSFSQRQFEKLIDLLLQEVDRGMIVSIGSKNKKTYIVKSFK
jgi:hypothetical protein